LKKARQKSKWAAKVMFDTTTFKHMAEGDEDMGHDEHADSAWWLHANLRIVARENCF
jgi:hypothetical protein